MFRRLSRSLPKDPVFPADLDELGYFINERDQIRYKKKPELEFIYKINKNDRINEIQREAVNSCIRDILERRFENSDLVKLRLPFAALPSEPHVNILTSPDIGGKSRVIVFFGESTQDLGVLAYRTISGSAIHQGSLQDFVQGILSGKANTMHDKDGETPGIVIANSGQLIWNRGREKSMTMLSWLNQPNKTAVHDSPRIDPVKNHIPGNENVDNHVAYIFEKVLGGLVSGKAQVDVIALEWTSRSVIQYLKTNWSRWSEVVSTLVLGAPQHSMEDILGPENEPTSFTDFMSRRSRAYLVSTEGLEMPVAGREDFGCNCYSAGESVHSECVMVEAWQSMLAWLSMVRSVEGFAEVEYLISNEASE